MIDWVHFRGREWGRWLQRENSAWPATSLMARIREEGSVGAAIKSHVQRIPVTIMPADVADFHRAWLRLDERHRNVVAVIYRSNASRDEKAEALGTTKSHMYRLLDQAHGFLSAYLRVRPDYDLSHLSPMDAGAHGKTRAGV